MRLKMFADGREILDSGDVFVRILIIIKQTISFSENCLIIILGY